MTEQDNGEASGASPGTTMVKRSRDDMYVGTEAERLQRTKSFIRSLRFSKPLKLLRQVTDRAPCPKCGKKRQYFCYDCLAVCHRDVHPPPLSLPIDVTVVFHPGEHRGKSTSLPAATIAPEHIHIVTYPEIPEGLSPSDTLVLYPSPSSTTLDSIDNLDSYKHVVFVDSTWQQSKQIARDPRIVQFRHVRIQQRESLFWRFQDKDPSYLATVEAIYYFLREYTCAIKRRKQQQQGEDRKGKGVDGSIAYDDVYAGEVDDLLYYYINQYILVQQQYSSPSPQGGNGVPDEEPAADGDAGAGSGKRKFTARHFGGYVLSNATWDDLLQ